MPGFTFPTVQLNAEPVGRRGRTFLGTLREVAIRTKTVATIQHALDMGGLKNKWNLTSEDFWECPVFVGYLGLTAGYATWPCRRHPRGMIELHSYFFNDKEFNPARFKDLVETWVHEVGHILDTYRRSTSDHSKIWRQAMADLGMPNETRCHSIPRRSITEAKLKLRCINGAFAKSFGSDYPCWEGNTTQIQNYSKNTKCPECGKRGTIHVWNPEINSWKPLQ